ncbi:adenylyl-sulfate kinase [Nocardioides sp. R-C-SC26]|uniref:adenylyl-sulfate kinase n=1 Tax=Nocardioides sp. R-C-SC26 TaxID=2870414 RepID=UPI001E59D462|nr:adenylyl-sulfate kinase [Nocardioides sp. R-C-SC26]
MSSPSPQPAPQHCPSPRELDDLELLLSGALAPLRGFDEPGSVVTLSLPPALADVAEIELVDPEGLPLATATRAEDGSRALTPLSRAAYGPFRRLYLTPDQVRAEHAGRTVVPVTGPITDTQLDLLVGMGPIVLLALVGAGTSDLSSVATLRATLRVAEHLDAVVVAVPLAAHGDAEADHALGVQVVSNYAGEDPVLGLPDAGEPLAHLFDIIEADLPAPAEQGLVLFFTGLSGSGKSTLARALMDRLLEQGVRSLTSLDGDVVRRNLSAGLTFSKEDRETNIRRIGWVAAEISRHGGVAVCSPIAPFDETRQQVRQMVDDAGGAFFLVHVATPLEECERRDRKGLYAKARRGEIPEFTGISSPYEEPQDADVRVDTTGRTIDDALDDVVDALAEAGYLDLRTDGVSRDSAALAARTPSHSRVEDAEERGRLETPASDAKPFHVLFVCTANICRSPYMELTARASAEPERHVVFASAGTHGMRAHPMDEPMASLLRERAIDTGEFRSQPVTPTLLAWADLVLTAESSHRSLILEEHPEAFRKVFTLGQFVEGVEANEELDRDTLLQRIVERRAPANLDTDVADPYGRGDEAARRAAATIDYLLRIAVPALTRR